MQPSCTEAKVYILSILKHLYVQVYAIWVVKQWRSRSDSFSGVTDPHFLISSCWSKKSESPQIIPMARSSLFIYTYIHTYTTVTTHTHIYINVIYPATAVPKSSPGSPRVKFWVPSVFFTDMKLTGRTRHPCIFMPYTYIYIYVYIYIKHTPTPTCIHTHTHTYIYIYIHIHIYLQHERVRMGVTIITNH